MAALPVLADGEEITALNVTVDGRPVVVSMCDGRARAHVHEPGSGWRAVMLGGVTGRPCDVDLLPDGEIVVVLGGSAPEPFQPPRDNTQVFDADGRVLRSFRLGRAVGHLAVDEPGTIWAGYSDEGVYSDDPLSGSGLARFDEYGRKLWTYRPPDGFGHISDLYALNVGAREAWAYYYTGFPLIRVTDTGVTAIPPGPVRGAQGVLIHEGTVVFVGGYQTPGQLTECRLRGGVLVEAGPVAFGPLVKVRLVNTRGSRLYVRTAHSFHVADLADL